MKLLIRTTKCLNYPRIEAEEDYEEETQDFLKYSTTHRKITTLYEKTFLTACKLKLKKKKNADYVTRFIFEICVKLYLRMRVFNLDSELFNRDKK